MSGDLNHSPADITRYLLEDLGEGTHPEDGGSWPISVGYERDTADNVITIYNTAGRLHGRLQPTGITQQHHGVQVRVRGFDDETAYNKAMDVKNAFDGVSQSTVHITEGTDSFYTIPSVTITSDIIPVGVESEATRRRIYTLNALVAIRMTSP